MGPRDDDGKQGAHRSWRVRVLLLLRAPAWGVVAAGELASGLYGGQGVEGCLVHRHAPPEEPPPEEHTEDRLLPDPCRRKQAHKSQTP